MRKRVIKNIHEFAGKWVAVNKKKSEVVASGKNFEEVRQKVSISKKITFFQVPQADVVYSH